MNTRNGDIWELGRHRLMCGDCTDARQVRDLTDGVRPAILMTDPPYCSGGFREADRPTGSKGTDARNYKPELIANDTMTTRGYRLLMERMIQAPRASHCCYIFTDWRMWGWIAEAAELKGFGARSMVVWDKGTPGLGGFFRAQHELVYFGMKKTLPASWKDAAANVIQCKRTKNENHPTEKPVELLLKLLAPLASIDGLDTVIDPFAGSGTTIIASDRAGKTAYGMEIMPHMCDVAVRRWVGESLRFGQDVALVRDGKRIPYPETGGGGFLGRRMVTEWLPAL